MQTVPLRRALPKSAEACRLQSSAHDMATPEGKLMLKTISNTAKRLEGTKA
jgi:hypothetical protein